MARELDLPEDAVSARVTPAEKLRLVERLQDDGEVVAVTGDGVNDSPALRRADVGVAMGRSGTEAAREASDLVLTNDDFSTIVAAIREGRAIGDNIRKFVAFLLSANLGEVLLFASAIAVGLGAPMTVVQVLAVNVLTDGFPAVALTRDPPAPDVMQRPPERGTRLFGRESWAAIALVGALVGAAALGAFLMGRSLDEEASQTMAFATLALGELGVVFAVRSPIDPAWKRSRNPYLFMGVATSALLLVTHDLPADPPRGIRDSRIGAHRGRRRGRFRRGALCPRRGRKGDTQALRPIMGAVCIAGDKLSTDNPRCRSEIFTDDLYPPFAR